MSFLASTASDFDSMGNANRTGRCSTTAAEPATAPWRLADDGSNDSSLFPASRSEEDCDPTDFAAFLAVPTANSSTHDGDATTASSWFDTGTTDNCLENTSCHLLGCVGDMPVSGRHNTSSQKSESVMVSADEPRPKKTSCTSTKGCPEERKLGSFDTAGVVSTAAASSPKSDYEKAVEVVTKLDALFHDCMFGDGINCGLFDRQRMISRAQKMFRLQHELRQFAILDTSVDVGYHYTKRGKLKLINENGLLSSEEQGVVAFKSFGPGIYTANNPMAFQRHGEVGIMVLRIKGNCSTVIAHRSELDRHSELRFNTVIGNKMGDTIDPKHVHDEVVLRRANQVIPVLHFDGTECDLFQHFLHRMHVNVQSIVDYHFNDGRRTVVSPYVPAGDLTNDRLRKKRRFGRSWATGAKSRKKHIATPVVDPRRPAAANMAQLLGQQKQQLLLQQPKQQQPKQQQTITPTPPRLFDPTSPLWGDFPVPPIAQVTFSLPNDVSQLTTEASPKQLALTQGDTLANQANGPADNPLQCFFGDTSLPPPFDCEDIWQLELLLPPPQQAQPLQQLPLISDQWGFPDTVVPHNGGRFNVPTP